MVSAVRTIQKLSLKERLDVAKISRVQPRVVSAARFSGRGYIRKFQPLLNAAAFSRISRTAAALRNV